MRPVTISQSRRHPARSTAGRSNAIGVDGRLLRCRSCEGVSVGAIVHTELPFARLAFRDHLARSRTSQPCALVPQSLDLGSAYYATDAHRYPALDTSQPDVVTSAVDSESPTAAEYSLALRWTVLSGGVGCESLQH